MSDFKRNSVTPALCYRDANAAFDWLKEAFGFEPAMLITDDDGKIGHSEMRYGDSLIMVGNEWDDATKSPASLNGKTTQTVHVHLDSDIDAHCAKARKAGAVILQEPAEQFYGDRTYRARDPEGHIWTFSQTIKNVSVEEMEKASGLRVRIDM